MTDVVISAILLSHAIKKFCGDAPKARIYVSQPELSLRQIRQIRHYLNPLATSCRVPKICSGPYIALTAMAQHNPRFSFECIEPMV